MKKRKHIFKGIFAVVVLIILVMAGVLIKSKSDLKNLANIEIQNVDLSEIEDGSYEGKYKAFPISVQVNVNIKSHVIDDIIILKHINGQGSAAEKITENILKSQSLEVDAVSGATYSSKVIVKAVEDALKAGK